MMQIRSIHQSDNTIHLPRAPKGRNLYSLIASRFSVTSNDGGRLHWHRAPALLSDTSRISHISYSRDVTDLGSEEALGLDLSN